MSLMVSVSEKGQNRPKPSKSEREAAESMDTGRKAVEKPLQELIGENRSKRLPAGSMDSGSKAAEKQMPELIAENRAKRKPAQPIAEPIGLEMETKGDQENAQ